MRRPHGYFYGSADAQHGCAFEADSLMCPHCNAHFAVVPNATPAQLGQFCTNCMAQCCTKPACNDGCRPFMKAIEAQEAKGRLRAALCLLVLLLASPVWAQVPEDCPAVKHGPDDIRVKCKGGGSYGARRNPDGSIDEFRHGRSPKTLGLVPTWNGKRLGKQPAPELVPIPVDLPAGPVADVPMAFDASTVIMTSACLWTPRTETAGGGASAMQALCAYAMAAATNSYVTSGINAELQLAVAQQVAYVEGNISTDLGRLRSTTDGHMDTIHAVRDLYGADVVTLIGEGYAAQGACGVGYQMAFVSTGFATQAFNVVDRTCAGAYLSYAHEVGHNQGLQHDPVTVCGLAVCSGYNYGHNTATWRTVMSYGGQTRIQRFSTPLITYGGVPLGIALQRDNAQRLRENMATVAAFRGAVSVSPVITNVTLTIPSAPVITGVVLQ